MTMRWIATRVIQEIVRDRRTLAFFFLVPVFVMTLVYFALLEEETARVGVVTRGSARLFEGEIVGALEAEADIEIVTLKIPDDEGRPEYLRRLIRNELVAGRADGVLYMPKALLEERFAGESGALEVFVEGTRPTRTAAVFGGISGVMDELAAALPVVIDASCSSMCAESVNPLPIDLKKLYVHGSEDYRSIDFFLPVLPPFFVFFFTFILATITFQRERVRGTLERLLIAPVSFGQVVLGYVAGFGIFAGLQATIVMGYFLALFRMPVDASTLFSLGVVVLLMLLTALTLGMLASFVAHNEFQAMQFIPLVVLPQIFLSDIIWDIESFPVVFQFISYALPLTHANEAMRDVLLRGATLTQVWVPLATLFGFFVTLWALLTMVGRKPQRAL